MSIEANAAIINNLLVSVAYLIEELGDSLHRSNGRRAVSAESMVLDLLCASLENMMTDVLAVNKLVKIPKCKLPYSYLSIPGLGLRGAGNCARRCTKSRDQAR